MGQTALIHVGEDGGEKTGGPLVVGIGKSGTRYRFDPQMVKVFDAGFEISDTIPQTRSGRKLHGKQVHQPAPSGKSPGLAAGPILGFQLGKMMSRNYVSELVEASDERLCYNGPWSGISLLFSELRLTHLNSFTGDFGLFLIR